MTRQAERLLLGFGVLVLIIGVALAPLRADYASQAQLANDALFQSKVKIAGFVAAIAVSTEAPSTANHAKRVAFAQQWALSADLYVAKLAFGVAADPAIVSGSSDSAIQTRVNAIWDTYAGQ